MNVKIFSKVEAIDCSSIGIKFIFFDYTDDPYDFYHQYIYQTTKFGDKWVEDSKGKSRKL